MSQRPPQRVLEASYEQELATAGHWALASDGVQWILQRRYSNGRKNLVFARSRIILARCMREGGVPDEDAAVLLAGLPATFDQWLEARPLKPLDTRSAS